MQQREEARVWGQWREGDTEDLRWCYLMRVCSRPQEQPVQVFGKSEDQREGQRDGTRVSTRAGAGEV